MAVYRGITVEQGQEKDKKFIQSIGRAVSILEVVCKRKIDFKINISLLIRLNTQFQEPPRQRFGLVYILYNMGISQSFVAGKRNIYSGTFSRSAKYFNTVFLPIV